MEYGNQGVQRYREANLGSMSPEKMIVALYERTLRDLDDARAALDRDDRPAYNDAVCHAQSIVTELRGALDHEVGGAVAANLDALYSFVFQTLLRALADRGRAPLDACTQVLTPLVEAWRQVPAGAGEEEARRRAAGANPATDETAAEGPAPAPAAAPGEPRRGICVTV